MLGRLRWRLIDLLDDIVPSCPSGGIGRTIYRFTGSVCLCVYLFLGKWFVPVTLPLLIAVILMTGLLIELPLVQGIVSAAMVMGLLLLTWNEFYTSELLRRQVAKLEGERDEFTVYKGPGE